MELFEDFKKFLFYTWRFLGLPPPTPVQYEIADYLQHGPKRKIIEGFRGVGKSWITSAFVCFGLGRNPEEKYLIVSASKTRSDDFSIFTQRLIHEMEILNHLKPTPDQRFSKVAFDVGPAGPAHAPSVKSVGIFGQLTGSRATHVIADDIEVTQNSLTQDNRERLIKAVSEFEALIVPEVGKITFLGTPQSEESIYNVLREKGYEARIWPARYPNKTDIYRGALAPTIQETVENSPETVGRSVDPKRFTDIDLIEREASYGRSGFSLQFMLDTTLSDQEKYPLKTGDLVVMDLNPDTAPISLQYASSPECQIKELQCIGFTGDRWYRPIFVNKDDWREYEGSVMFIDPAGRGGDETGYAVVKQLHGKLFCTRAGGLRGGYEDPVLEYLAKVAKSEKVNTILIESNFGDGMYLKLFLPVLLRHHQCKVEEVRATTQKERRIIDTLEPVLNQHRLVMNTSIIREDLKLIEEQPRYSLFYQLTRITRDRGSLKHDDRLDALAGAVAYWVESMAKDEDKSVLEYRSRQLEEELRKFAEHVFDKRFKPSSGGFVELGFGKL